MRAGCILHRPGTGSRRLGALAMVVSLALCASRAQAQGSLTLTPSSHDFGKAAPYATIPLDFRITGVTTRTADSLRWVLTGPNADDWTVNLNDPRGCWWTDRDGSRIDRVPPQPFPGTCSPLGVAFRPKSLGPKTAVLEVTDHLGGRAVARLTGEGVEALCTSRVVFCNYAHHYSGKVSWTNTDSDADSRSTESVVVTITKGEAFCDGSQRNWEANADPQVQVYDRTGPGLFAVEFLVSEGDSLKYRLSVACPDRGEPVDVRHLVMIADLQEAVTRGQDLLMGTFEVSDSDPINATSSLMRSTWELSINPLRRESVPREPPRGPAKDRE